MFPPRHAVFCAPDRRFCCRDSEAALRRPSRRKQPQGLQPPLETALVPLGVGASERRSSAARALADVGLSDRARHLPSELSGGQQQRVAIARALVKKPTVVLADEPTGNLDESTRDEIISLLDDMWRSRGLTLVLVTHDSTIAGRAQRIGLMRNGQLDIKQDTRHGAS